MGQWLRLSIFNAGGTGSIPGWGSYDAVRYSQKKKKKGKKFFVLEFQKLGSLNLRCQPIQFLVQPVFLAYKQYPHMIESSVSLPVLIRAPALNS